VRISYGRKSNGEWLSTYGFVPRTGENDADSLVVPGPLTLLGVEVCDQEQTDEAVTLTRDLLDPSLLSLADRLEAQDAGEMDDSEASLSLYGFGLGSAPTVTGQGLDNPRVLAQLAALCRSAGARMPPADQEPPYSSLPLGIPPTSTPLPPAPTGLFSLTLSLSLSYRQCVECFV
jgi:hypothetical protein